MTKLTRDEMRSLFAESGLTYADLTIEKLRKLVVIINGKMKESNLIQGTYRCNGRVKFQELDQLNGLWATDRPDLIPLNLKDVFFRIGYPKEDLATSHVQKDPLDTAGNRHPQMRYAGYKGHPLAWRNCNADEIAAYDEGVRASQKHLLPNNTKPPSQEPVQKPAILNDSEHVILMLERELRIARHLLARWRTRKDDTLLASKTDFFLKYCKPNEGVPSQEPLINLTRDEDVLRIAFEKTSWFERFADERKEYSPVLENYLDEELSDLFSVFVDGADLFTSQAQQEPAKAPTADLIKVFDDYMNRTFKRGLLKSNLYTWDDMASSFYYGALQSQAQQTESKNCEQDKLRIDWLQSKEVDLIQFDNFKLLDVKNGDLRKAIDAAMSLPPAPEGDE